ncbi:MAG TPA: class I SAM-dependent methyltransferase [Candidatus Borkfalkia faecipullorum]|uniref:Class I SAM-dependent methyltransferase n=1 Tax=Candidatus Borkfalkia faecipullorum TaxID=2838510 RepID=A0A9D1V6G2_9FIRM|nr:class I SAM-dependent methyltransferase [Candidatus Borkfalkia faecipullorum]
MHRKNPLIYHYDTLIDENDDPTQDLPPLREYMDQWDGEPFLSALALSPDKCVLEIGVGTGRLALRTAPRCKKFTGIDLSPKTIERAEKNLASFQPRLICADFLTFPFPMTFDIIYSSLTFFHIRKKKKALKKIFRLLSAGGRFVLSVEKEQRKKLVCGSREIRLYPDSEQKMQKNLLQTGFFLQNKFETPFAIVFVAQKPC